MIQPKKTQSKRDHVDKQREEGGESVPEPVRTTAILSSVAYCCASVFMVLANKTLVTTFKFRHFLLLVCMQNALSLVSMLTLKLLGVVKLDCSVQPQTAISWSPVNVFFLLMLFTGSASLHGLPLSVVTIFKNTTNIIIAGGDYMFFSTTTNALGMFSFVLTLVSTIYTASDDFSSGERAEGYAYMVLNCISTASYVLYLRYALKSTQLSKLKATYYNNLLSLPLIFIILIANGDLSHQLGHEAFQNFKFLLTLLGTGLGGMFLSLSSMWCIRETSATTYCVVGAANKVVLVGLGMLLFAKGEMHMMTGRKLMFIAVGIASGMLYGYSKLAWTGQKRAQ